MFCSGYSVSLCCCMYCLCVNVYCTTAIGCQPNCSEQNISISKCQISTTAIPSSLSDAIPHPYIFHVLKSILISSHSLRVCVCVVTLQNPPPQKKNSVYVSSLYHMPVSYPAHMILLDLINLMIFSVELVPRCQAQIFSSVPSA